MGSEKISNIHPIWISQKDVSYIYVPTSYYRSQPGEIIYINRTNRNHLLNHNEGFCKLYFCIKGKVKHYCYTAYSRGITYSLPEEKIITGLECKQIIQTDDGLIFENNKVVCLVDPDYQKTTDIFTHFKCKY